MLTTITQAALQGKTAEASLTDNRRLNPRKKNRANNTVSPRTRDGAKFPGGKTMRKAMERLARRQTAFANLKDSLGFTKPGSMTR